MPTPSNGLTRLAERLRDARAVAILTGAGVSAASGVPTFRGSGGLWRNYRGADLATPEAFARDPVTVWEWYGWRREQIGRAEPNAAHRVLAEWSRTRGWRVITQNVDDLHLRAGTEGLVRLHGSIWELSCWRGCHGSRWRDETVPLGNVPPTCPRCGGLARPAVVWFGEPLDRADVNTAEALASSCDVFIAAGTSAVVYPAAGLVHTARAHGAFTAELNLEPTAASDHVDVAIHAPIEQTLPSLAALIHL